MSMEFMMKSVIVPAVPFFSLVEGLKKDILETAEWERQRMFVFERTNLLDLTVMFFNMILDSSLLVNGKSVALEDMWAEKFHIFDDPKHDEMTTIIDSCVADAVNLLDDMSVDTSSYTEIARGVFPHMYSEPDGYTLRKATARSRLLPEALIIRPLGHYSKFESKAEPENNSITLNASDILKHARKRRNGTFQFDGFRRELDTLENSSNPFVEALLQRSKQERQISLVSDELLTHLSREHKVKEHVPIKIK